jgi:hypothetical protein
VTRKAASHAVLNTVTRSCRSADRTITPGHVPRLRDLDDNDLHTQLAQVVLPFAHEVGAGLQHPDDGVVRFDHDHYRKIWALTGPKIDADLLLLLLLDQAQDTNPVERRYQLVRRALLNSVP